MVFWGENRPEWIACYWGCLIAGVIVVKPDVHGDNRGRFVETFRQEWLPDGAPPMVQGNRADRTQGALVGLHYHRFQADYWYVPSGRATH